MSVVHLSRVRKSFGTVNVLNDVSLSVERGEVVALIGQSGSGKSTLLRCINGLETIQGGEIRIEGELLGASEPELRRVRQHVGMVFQSYNLFPHLTVERNVTLALTVVKKLEREAARSIAQDVLGQVGLADRAGAYPDQLSGGQQQRVAIARSLAMQPKVMLFDEVTSALDPRLTHEVLRVMEDLAASGMTMIVVTHEMAFARNVADTLVFMHAGCIWEQGEPESAFAAPKTQELRQFISFDEKRSTPL